jgi:competence protein ComEA
MMRTRKRNNSPGGFLLLLLLLVALTVMKGNFSLAGTEGACCEEKLFVQISGDVVRPGVYEFCKSPDLKKLLVRAGGLISGCGTTRTSTCVLFNSGANIDVRCREIGLKVIQGEMSAFYRITFGMPVSLNRETQEGLTAIPGIGWGIARSIVRKRNERGGFKSIDDILSIQGIGPSLYRKISPYLVL